MVRVRNTRINLELISPFSQGLLLFLDTMDIVSKYVSGIGLQYMLFTSFLELDTACILELSRK